MMKALAASVVWAALVTAAIGEVGTGSAAARSAESLRSSEAVWAPLLPSLLPAGGRTREARITPGLSVVTVLVV